LDLPFYREYDLPWTTGQSQDKKFQRLLGIIFLICAVLSLVWPFIPVPEPDPFDVEEIPPRIAQLLLEEKPLPPPPPPEVVEEPEPEPEPEPELDEQEPELTAELDSSFFNGQIALANEVFTPSEEMVAQAKRILEAMEVAQRQGAGAVTLDGKLIDLASIRQAEVIVGQARLVGAGG